jgi:long-chain acyl-CoA synthetase
VQLGDFAAATSLVRLFLDRAGSLGDQPFLSVKRGGQWQSQSWSAVADKVCRLAEQLRAMGLAEGDRVLLVSENRPAWCIADLAIMAAGCVTTPAYTTNTARDHAHVLRDSGARAVIVSSSKLAKPLVEAIRDTGTAEHLIAIEPFEQPADLPLAFHHWDDLLRGDAALARQAVEQRLARVTRDDLACIIYTSGTGGAPRGVMLHHGAILANVEGAATALVGDFGWGPHRFLSFLPLSHAFEHTAGQMLPIGIGGEIWYAEGLEKLSSNIAEAKPTLMVVVPRLFEVLRTRITKQVEKEGRLAAVLLGQAVGLAERRAKGRWRPGELALDFVLERTLRPKIRTRFGGRLQALVSGGAPLNPQIGRFFQALGLTVLQGYGQTEAAPVISCNYPSAGIRMETVGPPLKGTEVRVAEDGELLVRGELVMKGYWNNPEETAKALQGGWLHTGDIGHFDERGRIVITDRKKDMIVNDKGDNIAPQKVEGLLTMQPEIGQAMIYGEQQPHVVALIVPDAEWSEAWAKDHGHSAELAALAQLPEFRAAVRQAIERVNADLSVIEKVRSFAFADEPFSIQNGEMTPSLKNRRHVIRSRYAERLEALYSR